MPAIKTPSGIVVSQTPAICHVLGHELGLAPKDAAADAKALQICCDAVDFITEATKPDFAMDRKQKWLTHFAAVTSADAPVNYSDFLLFTALELAISSFTAAIDESEYPVSMRRPPRHRRDRPRHSRAGRPRRVVEQNAENEGRGTQCPVDGVDLHAIDARFFFAQVAALKGKGKKLMPGEHNKAW